MGIPRVAGGDCPVKEAGSAREAAMGILMGTSGFSYDDWRGFFYPEELPKRDMLAYYAQHFPAVEVNASYYQIPPPPTFFQMARKVPRGFQFVVKAHRDM